MLVREKKALAAEKEREPAWIPCLGYSWPIRVTDGFNQDQIELESATAASRIPCASRGDSFPYLLRMATIPDAGSSSAVYP